MTNSIDDRARTWTMGEPGGINYCEILSFIHFRSESFDEYHPTIGPFPKFETRLPKWLDSAPLEEDQKALLRMVPHIVFLGSNEFISLYRTAFNEHVLRWLITLEGFKLDDSGLGKKLAAAVSETWFCPVTDSMHIADFYHVNNIFGRDLRPDWLSLDKFSSGVQLEEYMEKQGIKYLVLLEDFVGSGIQMEDAVRFALELPTKYPVLLIPLVVCPSGTKKALELAEEYNHLWFAPVFSLTEEMCLGLTPRPNEPPLYPMIREMCVRLRGRVCCGSAPFGFEDTGALFVMYTNCPDNTLPLIHKASDEWQPLFPRSSRL